MSVGIVTPILNGVGLITFKIPETLLDTDWFIAATLAGYSKASLIPNLTLEQVKSK